MRDPSNAPSDAGAKAEATASDQRKESRNRCFTDPSTFYGKRRALVEILHEHSKLKAAD